jgi:hypothetical protein
LTVVVPLVSSLAVALRVGFLSVAGVVGCRIGGKSRARRLDHAMLLGVAWMGLRAPIMETGILVALIALATRVDTLCPLARLTVMLVNGDMNILATRVCGNTLLGGYTCRASAYGAASNTPSRTRRLAPRRGGSMPELLDATRTSTMLLATTPARPLRTPTALAAMGCLAHPAMGLLALGLATPEFAGVAPRLGRALSRPAVAVMPKRFVDTLCTQFEGSTLCLGKGSSTGASGSAPGWLRGTRDFVSHLTTTLSGSRQSEPGMAASTMCPAPPSAWRRSAGGLPTSAPGLHQFGAAARPRPLLIMLLRERPTTISSRLRR